MGKFKGFLEYQRRLPATRKPEERINDYKELYIEEGEGLAREQAARCMDCGVPFCHNGCPVGNNIPDFNDAAYKGDWKLAIEILSYTNNFPEFTGRICPAPCESSCVLGINKPPVAIEYIEKSIAEKAFELGYIKPNPPQTRTGKKVAVIGSGPAGLAAASQLNKAGHYVTVYEKNNSVGGLLRYGIPDFKLEKWVVERRVDVMRKEGIAFVTNTYVGRDITAESLKADFDAILVCTGAEVPRDMPIPGRSLRGVHFAMDFLTQQNKSVADEEQNWDQRITATGKRVVVIGGGDTGSDCVGTSIRQKAKSVTQIELLGQPPLSRTEDNPWPQWPLILRTSSSHEEGCDRNWAILTKAFVGDNSGNLMAIRTVKVDWETDPNTGKSMLKEIEGTEEEIPCDLALLAIGFTGPQQQGVLHDLGVQFDERGNVDTRLYQTNVEKVFAAGDARRGQSLVVWAISEGREAARKVDIYLMGQSSLESKSQSLMELI